MDHGTNFFGVKVDVTPLEDGPALVHAEIVPEEDWELGKESSGLRLAAEQVALHPRNKLFESFGMAVSPSPAGTKWTMLRGRLIE